MKKAEMGLTYSTHINNEHKFCSVKKVMEKKHMETLEYIWVGKKIDL